MSTCKGCGAPIDWITTKEDKYMPVDPEPVFIIEGDSSDRFVTDEGEVLLGRQALTEEERTGLEVGPTLENLSRRRTLSEKQGVILGGAFRRRYKAQRVRITRCGCGHWWFTLLARTYLWRGKGLALPESGAVCLWNKCG